MNNHKDLDVWKNSIVFVKRIYETTKTFPREEMYGLTNQLRRASVSIPSNIAEGAARKGKAEFKQFLYIALGSLSEVETQLIISKEINFLEKELFHSLETELITIRKMLVGLIKSIHNVTNTVSHH